MSESSVNSRLFYAMQNLIRTGSIDLISDVHRSNEIFLIDVLINSSIRAFHRLQRSQEFFEFPWINSTISLARKIDPNYCKNYFHEYLRNVRVLSAIL